MAVRYIDAERTKTIILPHETDIKVMLTLTKSILLPLNEGNVIKTDVSYASSYDAIKKVIAGW